MPLVRVIRGGYMLDGLGDNVEARVHHAPYIYLPSVHWCAYWHTNVNFVPLCLLLFGKVEAHREITKF